jgi:endogenous inhibitor of DNA gyrase (YacG/DUF329 family)
VTDATPPRIIACPTCGKATAFAASNRWRPFCSERCRMCDLGGWASETYRVPAEPSEDDSPAPDASADRLK